MKNAGRIMIQAANVFLIQSAIGISRSRSSVDKRTEFLLKTCVEKKKYKPHYRDLENNRRKTW